MRRIALAMAPALGLLAAILPTLPAQSMTGLDPGASARGAQTASLSRDRSHESGRQTTVSTKAGYPDPITSVTMHPGPRPGETTIKWRAGGAHTDFFKIQTALTPFSPYKASIPDKGRHFRVFKAPGKA